MLDYAEARVRPSAPLWWRLALTMTCIYLPYAWLVVDVERYPWHDYRWTWIRMWPILPGLSTFFLGGPHGSSAVMYTAMGAMTAIGVGLFLYLAARSRRWVPVPTMLALALSILNSWIAFAIYRA